jgi:hypothetical protein
VEHHTRVLALHFPQVVSLVQLSIVKDRLLWRLREADRLGALVHSGCTWEVEVACRSVDRSLDPLEDTDYSTRKGFGS